MQQKQVRTSKIMALMVVASAISPELFALFEEGDAAFVEDSQPKLAAEIREVVAMDKSTHALALAETRHMVGLPLYDDPTEHIADARQKLLDPTSEVSEAERKDLRDSLAKIERAWATPIEFSLMPRVMAITLAMKKAPSVLDPRDFDFDFGRFGEDPKLLAQFELARLSCNSAVHLAELKRLEGRIRYGLQLFDAGPAIAKARPALAAVCEGRPDLLAQLDKKLARIEEYQA